MFQLITNMEIINKRFIFSFFTLIYILNWISHISRAQYPHGTTGYPYRQQRII